MQGPLPSSFITSTPWEGSSNSIWLGSVFILHRNLDSHLFPSQMSETDRKQVLTTCAASLIPQLQNGKVLTQEELTPHIKEYLFEHFILNEGFEQFDTGRGMVIDDTGTFLGLINVEDHIHIHLFEKTTNWDEAYQRLGHLDKELGKSMEFAFSHRFGHLTSDPMVCGTGLAVQTFLHIPALIHSGALTDLLCELGHDVIVRGLGQDNQFIADIALVENRFKLGVTEPDILNSVHKAAETLAQAEGLAKKKLLDGNDESMKDLVARAFGVLKHAHSLQIEETLTSLSLFELGKQLGWIDGGQSLEFKKCFFTSRRAHLHEVFQTQEPIAKNDLILKRAQYLHKELGTANLTL